MSIKNWIRHCKSPDPLVVVLGLKVMRSETLISLKDSDSDTRY